jgi:phosphoribosyl-ATP pyrophosphohydrolase
MSHTLYSLYETIRQRQAEPTAVSYTSRLFSAGENEILKKVGEEAIELILAAKSESDERLISETADLVYHLLVLLASRHVSLEQVEAELAARQK